MLYVCLSICLSLWVNRSLYMSADVCKRNIIVTLLLHLNVAKCFSSAIDIVKHSKYIKHW